MCSFVGLHLVFEGENVLSLAARGRRRLFPGLRQILAERLHGEEERHHAGEEPFNWNKFIKSTNQKLWKPREITCLEYARPIESLECHVTTTCLEFAHQIKNLEYHVCFHSYPKERKRPSPRIGCYRGGHSRRTELSWRRLVPRNSQILERLHMTLQTRGFYTWLLKHVTFRTRDFHLRR